LAERDRLLRLRDELQATVKASLTSQPMSERDRAPSSAEAARAQFQKALHDPYADDHNAAFGRLRAELVAMETEEEREVEESRPIHDLRAAAGGRDIGDLVQRLPEPVKSMWEAEGAERNFLCWSRTEGFGNKLVGDLYAWYTRRGTMNGGEFSPQDEAEFVERFKGRLTQSQIELLLEWHATEVQRPRRHGG
jgi:hypothetical protein